MLGDFDLDQINRYFECDEYMGLLIPPKLKSLEKMEYYAKVFYYKQNRERDMKLIRDLIIVASLNEGKFEDSLYFNFSEQVFK